MDGFIITIMQFKFGNPQSLDFLGIGGAETFENTFCQRSAVLEKTVHPGIGIGIERKSRPVNAAATRGIGEYRGCRSMAGWSAFEVVKTAIKNHEGSFHPFQPGFLILGGYQFPHLVA